MPTAMDTREPPKRTLHQSMTWTEVRPKRSRPTAQLISRFVVCRFSCRRVWFHQACASSGGLLSLGGTSFFQIQHVTETRSSDDVVGDAHAVHLSPVAFDGGKRLHFTQTFEGTRFAVIFSVKAAVMCGEMVFPRSHS